MNKQIDKNQNYNNIVNERRYLASNIYELYMWIYRESINSNDIDKIINNVKLLIEYKDDAITNKVTIIQKGINKSKNINIIFDTEEEELYCDIDVEQLERIILNILSNAIKYNKVNGNIDVIVKDKNEEVHIEVSDTGVGIPKDKVDIIFDRFERFDNKNAAIKEGSGIGLSIVKKLVDALGGKIEIKSEVDKGTTVRLIFKKSNSQNNLEQIYDMQHLEEKVNLEMSDIS